MYHAIEMYRDISEKNKEEDQTMFNYPKNELIAQNLFATLWLDYEYFEDQYGQENWVSCRVLNDMNYVCKLYADTREHAIEKFLSGAYKEDK